jgi:hypothetical protein
MTTYAADTTRRNAVAAGGVIDHGISGFGPGRKDLGSTTKYLKVGETAVPIVGNLATFTMTVLFQTQTTQQGYLYCERGSSGQPICKMTYNSGAATGLLGVTYRDNSGTLINDVGLTRIDGTGPVVATMRRTSNTAFELWINGRLDQTFSSGSMTSTFSEATLQNWIGGDLADNGSTIAGTITALILHNRSLAASEMGALAADPFCMLRY